MKTLIIGLGNPILTDDGIGIEVARSVSCRLGDESGVDVTELSIGGLALMETMIGYDKIILIDAMQTKDGSPGMVKRMNLDDLQAISTTQHHASPHDANLITALSLGKKLGISLPEDITIFAIEVENVTDFNDHLTPAVAAAVPYLTKIIISELANN